LLEHPEISDEINIRMFFDENIPLRNLTISTRFLDIDLMPSHVSLSLAEMKLLTSIIRSTTLKKA